MIDSEKRKRIFSVILDDHPGIPPPPTHTHIHTQRERKKKKEGKKQENLDTVDGSITIAFQKQQLVSVMCICVQEYSICVSTKNG